MAVKKSLGKSVAKKKKKTAARKRSGRSARKKKTAARKTFAVKKKTGVKKKTAAGKKITKEKTAAKRRSNSTKKTTKRAESLGRPRLPADAKLDLVFQKDYQAREVFAFLHVSTLRELEEFGPDEIIEKLTGPMLQTVGRIRKSLAMSNRSLKNDRKFALEFQAQLKRDR